MKQNQKQYRPERLVAACLFLLMCLPFALAQAQTLKVTGKVTDNQNEPMIGVSIVEKGTTNGCITDIDGNYTLNVNQGATIVYSFIGYVTQEKQAASGVMNIVLKEDSKTLDEVVVVGYGVQKKSSVTGAISQVKAEDIQNRSITRAEEALQGKTAGVQLVSTTSQPGSSPTIRIRGFSSNGTSDPLYVVDGLIVGDLSSIDPNNIKSMEVLKDAASAAIYGAQAGNGVVLITTKSGSKGTSSISYDFQYSISSLARRPKLLNSQEYFTQMKELDPTFTDANIQELIDNGTWDGTSTTDWYDVAFNASPASHHTLTFQGANDRGSYLLSLNNLYDNGIIREGRDTYKRLSVMLNADYNIKPWLKVGTTANYANYTSKSISDGSGGNSYVSMIATVMTLAPYIADTYPADALPTQMQAQIANGFTLLQNSDGDYYSCLGTMEQVHPMVAIRMSDKKNTGNSLMGTLYANLTPMKDLVFTTRLGYRIAADNTYVHNNLYYGSASASNKDKNGVTRTSLSTTYYQWENFVNYNTTLWDAHSLSAMLGMSYSQSDLTYVSAGVDKIAKNDPLYADVDWPAGDAVKSVGGHNFIYRKLSYFGRVGYDYKNRYMAQFAMRADAADSSVLPQSNRWGYFPSASLGWTLSNEEIFAEHNHTPVTFLKLRASWGQNGSTSNLGGYKYSNTLVTNAAGYPFSDAPAFNYTTSAQPSQLYNPDLKWETSEQLNIGFDLRAFKDRFSLSMDWYQKKTKDLIVSNIVIPFEAGNSAAPMNAGNVENKGFELEASWRDRIGDFNYSVSGNIATLKNKVTYLDPHVSGGRIEGSTTMASNGAFSAFEEGYPVWYFRGYQVDRLDEAGNPVFRDNDGNGTIDAKDKAMIGQPMPDFTYGLTLTASYKNFDLLIFGNGSVGNDVFMSYSYNRILYSLKEMYDQRWTPQNTAARYARPQLTNADKYGLSDAYVFDGSYFRIKQIQLGYTFPKQWTKKIMMDNLRVYASLDNFFLFTKYPGLDPEVSSTTTSGMGVDYGNYPTTKKVVFGLSVTF
ncbi:MAG: TonB-dependent receptor [Mediterranea sp.]|nr:TonB-dependent receptor [Mediterranea sp.]